MPDVQQQGGAPDVARLLHPEGQRMVRHGLRQEEHPQQHGLGFSIVVGNARNQRHYAVVERFVVEAGRRIKAANRIQIIVI